MAVTFTNGGWNGAASGTGQAVPTATSYAVGDYLVALMAYDNSGGGGADPMSGTISVAPATGAVGASVSAQTGLNDPGSASAGLAVRCVVFPVTTAIPTSTSCTVSWSGTVTVRLILFMKVSSNSGGIIGYRTNSGATGTNWAAQTTPSLNPTPSVNNTEGVLCWAGYEHGTGCTFTPDSDTTNGSWQTHYTSVQGAGLTGMSAFFQPKVVTATGTQSWNIASTVASDWILGCLIFTETPVPSITQAAYRFYDQGTEAGSVALQPQDTAHTGDITTGDGIGHLRVRLQSTTAVAIAATDDFQLQYEKNSSGTWINVTAGGAETLTHTYDIANRSANQNVNLGVGQVSIVGQGFNRDEYAGPLISDGRVLTKASFALSKVGTPTGNVNAELRRGLNPMILLATSSPIDVSILTGTPTWTDFTFPTPYPITDTDFGYYITVSAPTTSSSGNALVVGTDTTPADSAVPVRLTDSTWDNPSTFDVIYRVYLAPPSTTVVPYNDPSLTDGAATTNRLGAGTGSFVAGKVSETGLVTDLGWTANNYTELLYSLRLPTADFTNGDTVRFRVLRNGAVLTSYTQTPQINIIKTVVPPNEGSATVSHAWAPAATGVAPVPPKTGSAVITWSMSMGGAGAPTTVAQHVMDAGWFSAADDWIEFPDPLTAGSTIVLVLWTQNVTPAPTDITTSAGHVLAVEASNTAISGGTYSYLYTAPNTSTADGVRIERNMSDHRWAMAAWEVVNGELSQIIHDNIGAGSSPYSPATADAMDNGGVVLAFIGDDASDQVHLTNPTEYFFTIDSFPKTPMASGYGTAAPATTFTAVGTSAPATWSKQFWVITYEGSAGGGAGGPIGTRTPKGSTTTAWIATAIAIGKRAPRAQATTTYTEAVAAAGKRVQKGTTTATHAWATAAVGVTPAVQPKQGSAAVTYTEVPTTAGKRTPKGATTTAYVETVTAAGKRIQQGSAATTHAWATAAAGKRTPKAAATATHTWAPSAAGTRVPKGAAATTYVETTTAAGKRTPKATTTTAWTSTPAATGKWFPKSLATTTTHTWATTATGVKPIVGVKQGTAAVTYTETGTAAGKRVPKGSTVTAHSWATTASGTKSQRGSAIAGWTAMVSAAGKRTPKASALTSYVETPSSAGKRIPKATTTTVHAWTTAAAGVRPIVGAKQGFAIVNHAWATAAVGKRSPRGSIDTAHLWGLTAAGNKIQRGTAATSYTATSAGSGKRVPKSTAATSYTETVTAAGKKVPKGNRAVAYVFAVTAQGVSPAVDTQQGFAVVTHQWAPTVVGRKVPRASSAVTVSWTPTAAGKRVLRGAATTAHTWAPAATGKRLAQSVAVVDFVWTVDGVGFITARATAVDSYQFVVLAEGAAGALGLHRGHVEGPDLRRHAVRPVPRGRLDADSAVGHRRCVKRRPPAIQAREVL